MLFQASISLAPVNIFKAGADEEKAETARLVSSLSKKLVMPWVINVCVKIMCVFFFVKYFSVKCTSSSY